LISLAQEYPCLKDFFTRTLKEGVRPVCLEGMVSVEGHVYLAWIASSAGWAAFSDTHSRPALSMQRSLFLERSPATESSMLRVLRMTLSRRIRCVPLLTCQTIVCSYTASGFLGMDINTVKTRPGNRLYHCVVGLSLQPASVLQLESPSSV
jgi:hypothetical protein